MAALNLTTFNGGLKRHYHERRVRNLAERKNRFFGMVRKNEDVGGGDTNGAIKTPLIYRNPTGGSADYDTAESNQAAGGYGAFLHSHNDHFHVVKINHKVLKLSSYKEAFFKARKEIDLGVAEATNGLARKLYRTTGGSMGRVANTSFSTTTLTLTNKADVYNFAKGEVLKVNDTDDDTSVRSGTLVVAGINRKAGTLTTTADLDDGSDGISAIAENDYIFKEGDAGAGWTGLASYIPDNDDDAENSLHGLTRSEDIERLAGYRVDAGDEGMTVDQAIVELAASIGAEGGEPDYAFMHPSMFKDLVLGADAGRHTRRDVPSRTGYVSYSAIVVHGPHGDITCLADVNCPGDKLYVLDLDTWELKTAGMAPHIVDDDGLILVRGSGLDFKIDIYAYGDLACEAPGYNGVATF